MKKFTGFAIMFMAVLSFSLLHAQERISVKGPGAKYTSMSRAYHTLYEQLDAASVGRASQDFSASFPTYSCQGADDFVVGTGEIWEIEHIYAMGSNSGTAMDMVNVYFYNDVGGMPDATAFQTYTNIACTDIGGNLDIDLPAPLQLEGGTYWVSVQVSSDFSSYGQWFWSCNNTIENSQATWRNPGNGFGTGATTWTDLTTIWGDPYDLTFALYGEAYVEIGDGTGYGSYPAYYSTWSNYWHNCHTQVLYLASEIGGPKMITELAWEFERIATPDNWLENVVIKILPTSDNELVTGDYYDMSGATTVYSNAYYVPATSTGWHTPIDITDFPYSGADNLIIDILWGDNGYYEYPYYRTYKTYGSGTRLLLGYADSETPPNYDGASNYYDNLRVYFEPFNPPGDLEGYVFNYNNTPMPGSVVYAVDFPQFRDTADNTGYYFINDLYSGDQPVKAFRPGYYPDSAVVMIPAGGITQHDFILTQPEMYINPLSLDVVVNPNEYYETNLNILNNGNGPLEWMAEITYNAPTGPQRAYCAASGGCDEYISNVTIGDINNSSGCTGYGDYTDQMTNVEPGESYDITITNGNPIWTADQCGIWVDWNQNEDFYDDPPITVNGSPGVGPYTATITVPEDALSGPTRLRTRIVYASTPDPCGTSSYGEAEDYTLVVGGAPGGWLSLDTYEGTVPPFGGNFSVGTNFDATGFESGTTVYATITFYSFPDVGTIDIPVSMTVQGAPLGSVSDLEVDLTNMVTGEVEMSWTGINARSFLHYQIRRNGFNTATTGNTYYTDYLPEYGEYCYTVHAVYDEGNSAPAGPECVEWFIPTISVDPLALSATVWEGGMVEVTGLTIENTGIQGSVLQYSFAYDPADGFIYDVIPENGYLNAGQVQDVRVVYNAEGYSPGTYTQELDIESNDPFNATVTVDNTMTVIQPAAFAGRVTDGNTTLPLKGVSVTAGDYQAMTDNNGEYMFYVNAGTYDLLFEKPGYQPVTAFGRTATTGNTTTVDTVMFEMAYPPQFVTATVNDDDTECLVEWGDPAGPYEVVYDDGTAENMFVWSQARSMNAVKFTPAGYPCAVTGGRIYIGDGFFPQGGDLLGTNFGVAVFDDDGTNGMPGTMLDSAAVVVENFGWVEFDNIFAAFEEGDFYIAMIQGGAPPNTAGIGVDEEVPVAYRSYSKPVDGDWMVSTFQDFMMRALVDGPVGTTVAENTSGMIYPPKPIRSDLGIALHMPIGLPGGKEMEATYKPYKGDLNTRGVEKYRLIRYANFDPNDPEDMGDASTLSSNLEVNEYNDAAFGGLAMGWYKYGVSANFTNGDWSDTAISNIVGHLMDYDVTFYVSTTDGESPEGAEITFSGHEWPYEVYTATVPASGEVTIESVWRGEYFLDVYLLGYFRFEQDNNFIFQDEDIFVVLAEKTYPPRNLWVDPLTSIAYWNGPIVPPVFLSEDFEEGTMPNGWTTTSEGDSEWYVTQDGSSQYFNIPSHTWYAVCNDDAPGSGNNGCCDYLITPVLDLRDYNDYILRFQSFYNGGYGQLAYVEISTNGEDFFQVQQMATSNSWEDVIIDLSAFCGNDAWAYTWLAFHADDNGGWATGWAVDDVTIASAAANGGTDELEGYQVFLDGAYVASTPDSTYQYVYLIYNTVYTAGVAAEYSSGLSDMITYTFRSEYLIPPRNLEGENIDHSAYLTWEAPVIPATYSVPPIGDYEKNMASHSLTVSPVHQPVEIEPVYLDLPGREQGPIAWADDVMNDQWFSINVETYEVVNIASAAFSAFTGDFGVDDDQSMYVVNYQGAGNETLLLVDVETAQATTIGSINCPISGSGGIWTGFACDKETGVMYAMATDIAQSLLCTVNLGTGEVTEIGSTTTAPGLIEIAYNTMTNVMFGWDIVNDKCYTIDIATGEATELGDLGYDANYAQGGSWNPNDQEVYLASYSTAAELRILDQTTGGTQVLTGLAGETGAFGFPGAVGNGGGQIPDNLLSFNIYRDGAMIDNVDREILEYYDFNLPPGIYEYSITAVYDLQPYGLPGETAESMHEGPIDLQISFGYPLPFLEEWTFGNFEANEWMHECDNWWINTNQGNPAPSAEFTWDDTLNDYRCMIMTYPLLGTDIIDGDIMFEFDIKLDDREETETEFLTVQLWENGNWHEIAQFTNAGDMDWTGKMYKISDYAKGNDFMIAFVANGESSDNIFGWFIDNVHVYQQCAGPINIEAIYDPNDNPVEIHWIPPYSNYTEWLSYNDGSFENALASTNGGAGLAQLFTPPDYPATVIKVRYWNSDYLAYDQQNEIYILTGDGATILGGPYYVNNGPAADWVEIDVDPVTITEGSFMVATINTDPDGPFVGVDDSFYNGTLYFGTIGDWVELSELGQYFYVGSHEALVEMELGENVVLNSSASAPNTNGSSMKESDLAVSGTFGKSPRPMDASRDLLGFDIYRNHDGSDYIKLNDDLWPESPYVDIVEAGGLYNYYVVAVFDQCQGVSDTIDAILYVGIEEQFTDQSITVYPNPAQDFVNVESTFDIRKITVMNYVGQVVDRMKEVESAIVKLNAINWEEGVYFIKVETTEGVITKKITITR